MALVIAYEQGRVVARLPHVRMMPVWSVAVDGVVVQVERSRDGVVVVLEDGDAYRLSARTGEVVALPGIGLTWRARGDLVTGEAPGGPVPPAIVVPPPMKPEVYHAVDLTAAPAIATPWPPPPALPASWQLTLYELAGGVRARNDYTLAAPITPGLRAGSAPLVYRAGREALVIEPRHGDPLRRVVLPVDDAATFSTIVDGRAVVGTILAGPLRAVVF